MKLNSIVTACGMSALLVVSSACRDEMHESMRSGASSASQRGSTDDVQSSTGSGRPNNNPGGQNTKPKTYLKGLQLLPVKAEKL